MSKMTSKRFKAALEKWRKRLDAEVLATQRRLQRLEAAKHGKAEYTTFYRKPHWVKRYHIGGHYVTVVKVPGAKPKKED